MYALIIIKNKAFVVSLALLALVLYAPIAKQTVSQFTGRAKEQKQDSLKENIVGVANAYYRYIPGRTFLNLDPSPETNIAWAKHSPLSFIFFLFTLLLPLYLLIIGLKNLYKSNKKLFWQLLIPCLLFVALACVSSEIGSRSTRYLSFLGPIIFILTASSIQSFKTKPRIILTICLTIILVVGLASQRHRSDTSVGAREIAHFLNKNAKDGDAVVARGAFLNGESTILSYYLNKDTAPKKLDIIDFFSNYQPGNLDKLLAQTNSSLINKALVNHSKVWFYDFTYQGNNNTLPGITHQLGQDKEGMKLAVREISR